MLSCKPARIAGVAAFAAALAACAATVPLEQRTVTRANEGAVSAAVRDSKLSEGDKDAFATFLFENAKRPEAFEGKSVREVIVAQRAHDVGVRLEREDRASTLARRAAMSRVIALSVTRVTDAQNSLHLNISVANRSSETITGFDAGLEVDDKRSRRRVGLAELHVERRVPPHSRLSFDYPMRYVRFGEDTGSMRLARGRAKTATLDPMGVRFGSGRGADTD